MPIPKSVIARVMGLPLGESRYWIIWALLGKRRKENGNEHWLSTTSWERAIRSQIQLS